MKNGCLLGIALFFSLGSFANIRLPALLASNMVLQQQSTVRLWGWAEPGERVHVTTSWNNLTDSVTGTRDAKWQLSVATPAAGGPFTITLKGYNTIVLENVMIGEVWICSGQSNMEMCGNWGLPDIQAELPTCATNNIHFFRLARTTSEFPQEDCPAQWKACDSNELKSFSAAGYFFAKRLNAGLNVPIGMIESAWGGTPAEVWTPAELVSGDTLLAKGAAAQRPSRGWPYTPGYCYNAMIAPITNYVLAGALWYQGEGNTGYPSSYGRLFGTMIGSWRQVWKKELPFYYVQIAPFTYGAGNSGALIREQQSQVLKMPNTGMVVISDLVSDTTNIHPKDKHDVGYRLAAWALSETYHKTGIAYKSPMYKDMIIKGDKVTVNIDVAPGGLVLKGAAVKELMIAGADRVFHPAQGKIDGSHLIVWSADVKQPVAVRYQFDNAGIGNIFSKEGLPLAPFRTDDW
jgi:sialate O-acetylesterase